MKKIISITIFLFAGIFLAAQTRPLPLFTDAVGPGPPDVGKVEVGELEIIERIPADTVFNKVITPDGEIFTYAMEDPQYPEGDRAMKKFVEKNIVYPQISIEAGKQGTVIIGFVIEKDGTVADVHAVSEIKNSPQTTAEAIRVVSLFPKWAPGKTNGRAIRVKCQLPIKFYITHSERSQTQTSNPKPDTVVAKKQNEDSVYTLVDEMPKFPGDSMMIFLKKNIKIAQSSGSAKVYISFIVEKDGSLSDIHYVKGSPELSEEVVRVFSLMPNWLPGKMNGKVVRVKCVIPLILDVGE